ncbi:very short patch repair endonuclease [Methanoculleus bourgensis]|mgnify:CR=1 FL=1|uniref:very short patch repair endonuclease n=1 Tax=Methanoculleus bourgensis TaxID=83986 RepID=UPI0024918661|nr:very short patch repair endonuclease [Methanoculleus bourgensis]
MTDVLTKEQRKYNMSRIRGKDTSPEMKVRKMLYSHGIRGYRLHYKLPGKPDIVFIRKRIAIFIDGCYWHKCPACFKEPQTQNEFWMNKLNSNVERDRKVNEILTSSGWTVLRFWEHQVRKDPEGVVADILKVLKSAKIWE